MPDTKQDGSAHRERAPAPAEQAGDEYANHNPKAADYLAKQDADLDRDAEERPHEVGKDGRPTQEELVREALAEEREDDA